MARASTWTNGDGLEVGFGTHTSAHLHSGSVRTQGNVEMIQITLGYLQSGTGFEEVALPTAAGTAPVAAAKSTPIPANSTILRATLVVTEAYTSAGATTLSLGLKTAAGVDIDADGIDVTIAKSAIDTIGKTVRCDGALVTGATIGANDGYLSAVVATGPFTAGESILTIEYQRPIRDNDPVDPITGTI